MRRPTTTAAGPTRSAASSTSRLKDYDKAIEIEPKFAVAFANRGDVYAKKGERDRAILEYRQALVLEPGNDVALSGLKKLGAAVGCNPERMRCNERERIAPMHL